MADLSQTCKNQINFQSAEAPLGIYVRIFGKPQLINMIVTEKYSVFLPCGKFFFAQNGPNSYGSNICLLIYLCYPNGRRNNIEIIRLVYL